MARAFVIMSNPFNQNPVLNDAVEAASGYPEETGAWMGSILENWLFPGVQQKIEFGQQVALQEAQNQWNSESEKMRRMKEAGINPATAAGAVAGSGNAPATSSPNSAVGAGASLPNAVGSLAENVGAAMGSYETLSLTPVEREKRSAETVKALEDAGFSHWEAKAIEVMLPDRQKNLQADTFLKIANYHNTCEEYQNILLEHDQRKADIDLKQKQAYQAEKSGNLAEAMRLKTEAETDLLEYNKWWQETEKNFWLEHGYKSDDPLDLSLRNAAANGKKDAAAAVGNAIENYNYRAQHGFNRAEIQDGYKKAFEAAKANADVAAIFKEYNVDVDTWAAIFADIWHEAIENPKDLRSAIAKSVNQLINALGFAVNGVPPQPEKPKAGGKYGN